MLTVNLSHEIAVFAGFYGIAATAHFIQERWHKHCDKAKQRSRTIKVVALTSAIITHPSVTEAMREFCVHIVVYSGYILGH